MDGERLTGDGVIVAAGGWTGKLLPELAPALTTKRAIVIYLEPPVDIAAGWAGAPCFLDFAGSGDLYLLPPLDGMPPPAQQCAPFKYAGSSCMKPTS